MSNRYDVLCPVEYGEGDKKKTRWVRMGSAWMKENGNVSIILDAVPLNGKLMVMPPKGKDDVSF